MAQELIQTDPHLLRLFATTYRRMVILLGVGWLSFAMLNSSASRAAEPGAQSGSPLLIIVGLAFGVILAFHGYQIAEQLDLGAPALWAIGMFIPILNLLCLAILSRLSTAFCRARGVRVGFLGPNLHDIEKLEHQFAEARALKH